MGGVVERLTSVKCRLSRHIYSMRARNRKNTNSYDHCVCLCVFILHMFECGTVCTFIVHDIEYACGF